MKICALVFLCACQQCVALQVKKASTSKHCGVVLGSFGSDEYVSIGTKVAKYIRNLNVSRGWCPEEPGLASVPVAFFTDFPGYSCPDGIQCFNLEALAPWEGGASKSTGSNSHLGFWKYRWYHSQMLVHSPYELTLSLDVDALPCSGDAITSIFTAFKEKGVSLGSVMHDHSPCAMTPGGNCSDMSPAGTTNDDMMLWEKFIERNCGFILADKRKTKSLFEEWAANIRTTEGIALGDQLPYRQALFTHRNDIKEHIFNEKEVCRFLPHDKYNCNTGCLISHWTSMGALKYAGII